MNIEARELEDLLNRIERLSFHLGQASAKPKEPPIPEHPVLATLRKIVQYEDESSRPDKWVIYRKTGLPEGNFELTLGQLRAWAKETR